MEDLKLEAVHNNDIVDAAQLKIAENASGGDDSLFQDILGKIKSRINEGMEGQLVQNLKDKVGIDPDLLLQQESSSWSIGLILISVIFIGGGFAEASIHVKAEEGMNIPLESLTPDMPVVNHNETKRKPLTILLSLEMLALILSLGYTPLSLSLPSIALHQVTRIMGMAIKGKSIGGGAMRIGMSCIMFGFLLSCLFGYHQTLAPHGWEEIVDAVWSPIFVIWSSISLFTVSASLVIVFISPARHEYAGDSEPADVLQLSQSSAILSTLKAMRLNIVVYFLSIPVSWQLKRQAYAATAGILSGYLLLIAQQVTLTVTVAPHITSLLGFKTFMLTFACGLYALVCGSIVHKALATFESAKFLPAAMCWLISIGTANELVLQGVFGDDNLTFIRMTCYFSGLVFLCGGLICMGQADVKAQLEELQFLASEVSRLGHVIDGTFLEAGGMQNADSTPDRSPFDVGTIDDSILRMHVELGLQDYSKSDPSPPKNENERNRDAISSAFSMTGDNNYVQTILSDIRMS